MVAVIFTNRMWLDMKRKPKLHENRPKWEKYLSDVSTAKNRRRRGNGRWFQGSFPLSSAHIKASTNSEHFN